MKRFELSLFNSPEGLWVYLCENDAEAQALTGLTPGTLVIVKDAGSLYVVDGKGKLKG